MISNEAHDRILRENPICFYCGIRPSSQICHAIYADKKRFVKYLDMPENLMGGCESCNVQNKGRTENYDVRKSVYHWKKAHGYPLIKQWHESIPLRNPDRFE